MPTRIPYICAFSIDREKNKADARIRCRIRWCGNSVGFLVGYRVNILKWDADRQRCAPNTTHGRRSIPAAAINRELVYIENIVAEAFDTFECKGKVPTENDLRQYINASLGKHHRKSLETIYDYFDAFITESGSVNSWSKGTFQKFAALKKHLYEYDPQLTFDDLDENALNSIMLYLRETVRYRNSTLARTLAALKWFLRWATRKGYNTQLAYVSYSPKIRNVPRKVIFLDWEELQMLYNLKFDDKDLRLAPYRDTFCFLCFTGLRYSDAANLRRTDVFEDHIEVVSIKTADPLKIELNKYARAILDRYAGIPFPDNRALPIISNQKMNEALKVIGKLAGLDSPITLTYYRGARRVEETSPKYELLTTHCGRRTFICNALTMGIAPQIVMRWTGHSDYTAMKPYIDIADAAKASAMALFNR